jgi:hypothetical protein
MPIFRIFCRVIPGASIGTTIRLLFRCGGPSEVLASRQHQSACSPLVIHIFVPSITQSPPSARARVFSAATSDPAPGSLTPMQPTSSPAIEGARNSRLSSVLPNRARAGVHMSVCTPIDKGTPPQLASPRASAITRE